MDTLSAPFTMTILRHVFASWWISIPPEFDEDFVHEDGYWHAWDARRSVSLSSYVITDRTTDRRPVPARDLLARLPAPDGEPVAPPDGLAGWAAVIPVPDSPRASRAISGMLVVDGRVLLATITSDDIAWATEVWRSIQYSPTPVATPPAPDRAVRRATAGRRQN
jgi:hypothetical protein